LSPTLLVIVSDVLAAKQTSPRVVWSRTLPVEEAVYLSGSERPTGYF